MSGGSLGQKPLRRLRGAASSRDPLGAEDSRLGEIRGVASLIETHLEEPGVAATLATAIRRGARQARLFELEQEAAALRTELAVGDA